MRSQRRDLPWSTAPDRTRSAPAYSTSTSIRHPSATRPSCASSREPVRPTLRSGQVTRQAAMRSSAPFSTMHSIMHSSGHSDDDPMHGPQARNGRLACGTQMTYRFHSACSTLCRDPGHLLPTWPCRPPDPQRVASRHGRPACGGRLQTVRRIGRRIGRSDVHPTNENPDQIPRIATGT